MEVLLIIAQYWKKFKSSPTDEWLKLWYVHTMGYYSAMKKNELLTQATAWISHRIIMLAGRSKAHFMFAFI
jgi:hypothetical protein